MSFYADYLTERTSDKIVEGPSGFVTYRYVNEGRSAYIIDIYTAPKDREKKAASHLADMVAKEAREKGAVELLGTVVPSAKGSTASLKVLLAYGFSLHSSTNDVIVFRKDL